MATTKTTKIYDHPLLTEVYQLWLEGEWQKLLELEHAVAEVRKMQVKAEFAGLLASAQLQMGDQTRAEYWAANAMKWGCDQKRLLQLLVSGVNNTLGRISALQRKDELMDQYLKEAVAAPALWSVVKNSQNPVLQRKLGQLRQLGLLQQANSVVKAQVTELQNNPESSTSAQVEILRTEVELLSHELSIAQQRLQLYGEPQAQDNELPFIEHIKRKSTSQLGQDLWVLEKTNYKRNGFFVEFGATDGVLLSNSYLLEKEFGWKGICAEPNRKFFEQLKENRSCTASNQCIGRVTGEEVNFILADAYGGIAAFAEEDMHILKRKAYADSSHTTTLISISLDDFLEQYNAPHEIDYMSIDTEGSEYSILVNFPFEKWDIKFLTIEHNYTDRRSDINDLLTKNGYIRTERQWDDWFEKT